MDPTEARRSPSPHLRPYLPVTYWALKIMAFLPGMAAAYAVPVCQTSVLPTASFRFRLTADTLAVQPTVPRDGPAEDSHLQVQAPCRAHNNGEGRACTLPFSSRCANRADPHLDAVNQHRAVGDGGSVTQNEGHLLGTPNGCCLTCEQNHNMIIKINKKAHGINAWPCNCSGNPPRRP